MNVYWDTSPVIYYVQQLSPWYAQIINNPLFSAQILMSDLTKMESMILPLRNRNSMLIQEFEQFFQTTQIVPITAAVFQRASHIRADFNFKSIDSIHLAAAVDSGCDRFLTNDQRLSRFPDIVIDVI